MPGRKANTITTELKRILSNAVVRFCIEIRKQPCLREWSPVTHLLLKSSFTDDKKSTFWKSIFWTLNGINGPLPNPRQAPILRAKSITMMIEWCFTLLSTVFQSYYGDSSHYSCLSRVSPVLGWALKCLAQGHSCEKTQRIKCSSNPGPLDYESNTLPLSHAGPLSP